MSSPATFLDLDTEYSLRLNAPCIGEYSPTDVRSIIAALESASTPDNRHLDLHDRPYYWVFLQDLMPILPDTLTPKRAGQLCRKLCLEMRRLSPGYIVAWNAAQLIILNGAFPSKKS